MNESTSHDVTRILADLRDGDTDAMDRLFPLVYGELRSLAGGMFRRERPDHTLQPTAIVHEAYMRLVDQGRAQWQDRAHFFAIAAKIIRRLLVDHARRHGAEKRGGGRPRFAVTNAEPPAGEGPEVDLSRLDDALSKLALINERQARVVELRFFGGLDVEHAALVLGVSPRTVKGDWRVARAWLHAELEPDDAA